jgi:hypothetical protein
MWLSIASNISVLCSAKIYPLIPRKKIASSRTQVNRIHHRSLQLTVNRYNGIQIKYSEPLFYFPTYALLSFHLSIHLTSCVLSCAILPLPQEHKVCKEHENSNVTLLCGVNWYAHRNPKRRMQETNSLLYPVSFVWNMSRFGWTR